MYVFTYTLTKVGPLVIDEWTSTAQTQIVCSYLQQKASNFNIHIYITKNVYTYTYTFMYIYIHIYIHIHLGGATRYPRVDEHRHRSSAHIRSRKQIRWPQTRCRREQNFSKVSSSVILRGKFSSVLISDILFSCSPWAATGGATSGLRYCQWTWWDGTVGGSCAFRDCLSGLLAGARVWCE